MRRHKNRTLQRLAFDGSCKKWKLLKWGVSTWQSNCHRGVYLLYLLSLSPLCLSLSRSLTISLSLSLSLSHSLSPPPLSLSLSLPVNVSLRLDVRRIQTFSLLYSNLSSSLSRCSSPFTKLPLQVLSSGISQHCRVSK